MDPTSHGPALSVHGHFYQPPRENPWTEELSREPSAAPFHDWNERINAESYRANAWARIVDDQGRVLAIENNFALLSFDIGPTLSAWLETHAPKVLARVVDGDREGGGAIAQSYFHVILPLADERDARTQVRWGLAEFRHRFGREAEGIWLPETAVDDGVLAMLVEEGVRFTVLAPHQAAAVRPSGEADWTDVSGDSVDVRRPYRWWHPDDDGRGLDLVLYDGALSHDVAFGLPAMSGDGLLDRVVATAGDDGGLVAIAADGESFGHHHRWGERLVAYSLTIEAARRGVPVVSLARWIQDHPQQQEARVHLSSWSCAHGVGRWREDCGCQTGGDPTWNQRWRGPLRAALDVLHAHASEVFDRRGSIVLADPWKARDAYVEVLIGATSIDDFLATHAIGDRVEALSLLEAQRQAMAMYTSCGWFFNDLAGLETAQVLRYAGRLVDLLDELAEPAPLEVFFGLLDSAESNVAEEGTGRQVWHRHVLPVRVTAERVVAHYALVELLGASSSGSPERIGAYDVEVIDHSHAERGGLTMCSGQVLLRHVRTRRRSEHVYAAVHLGALEVVGASRLADATRDEAAFVALREAFASGEPATTILRLIVDGFGPGEIDLRSALPDAAEEIVADAARSLAERFGAAYDRLLSDHRSTLASLRNAGFPLPPVLSAPAELSLARRFEAEVAAQAGSWDPVSYQAALATAREASESGFAIDTPEARATLSRTARDAVARAVDGDDDALHAALALVGLARDLGLSIDIDEAQEQVYGALVDGRSANPSLRLLGVALNLAVDRLPRPASMGVDGSP
ncbi:MAG TPA: DUF3536 domain-containing protein [Acidimicrobiales bacterium]|nr:DUF3536 domain-containing protein [Acidimicrobiales bacterium]